MVDHIYCINLERSPERRENAQKQFDREGLEVEFFRATDGKVEAPDGLFITKSEWGCADSHIRIWRDMIENGYETVLVFEDDIELNPGFNQKLDEIIYELPNDWDFVNLDPNNFYTVNSKKFSRRLMQGFSLSMSAYIISQKCAREWSKWDSRLMKVQIDSFVQQCPVQSFHTIENLAHQDSKYASDIGPSFNRTMDWNVFINRWGLLIVFLIFIFLYRRVIFE